MEPFLSYKRGETPLDYRKRLVKGLEEELETVYLCLEDWDDINVLSPYLRQRREIIRAQITYYQTRRENQNAS